MGLTRISDLKKGQKATVVSFEDELIGHRLMSMGLRPGSLVEMVTIAPFNGGYYLKSSRQRIVIRASEASVIVLKQ